MAYVGNTPADKTLKLEKQQFSVSATTSYTLSHSVSDPQDIALFINNVRQNPNSSYTVSGTALTLSSATSASDTMYCVFLGRAIGTTGIGAGEVTKDKLDLISDSTAGLTVKGDGGSNDGYLQLNCRVNSHGIKLKSPPHSAGATYTLTFPNSVSADKFLKTDGSGNLSFASAGITEADQFVITSNAQISSGISDLTTNIARETDDNFSQIGTGMSESSGIFTFPRTGIYYISALGAWLTNNGAAAYLTLRIKTTTNNSSYTTRAQAYTSTASGNDYATSFNQYIFNVNDTTNRKVKFNIEVDGSTRLEASGTKLTFIRLGDAV